MADADYMRSDPLAASQGATSFELNTPYRPTPDNRPAPLERSPLALTREAHSQMSFGERAALEGVLGQLRPRLAIEIGTAEGGTLLRVASHSAEVHAIDLTHEDIAMELPGNVTLHTGPSAEVLPSLLNRIAASNRIVDFALVDGDHSFEGVAGDLRALLDSTATTRATILVHDTMNQEVRAGIESVGLDDYEKVVYYELDMVPGYMFREGTARDSVWGGLGLILCDEARSRAYSASPRQWRYHEPYAALHRMRAEMLAVPDGDPGADREAERRLLITERDSLRERLAAAEIELAKARDALQVVYGSRSWKLTAPVRAAVQALRSFRRSVWR